MEFSSSVVKSPALSDVAVCVSALFVPLKILFLNQQLNAAFDGSDVRSEAAVSLTDHLIDTHTHNVTSMHFNMCTGATLFV